MLRRIGLVLAVALSWSVPVQAQPERLTEIQALQARDIQLFRIGWKLVTGNAPYCRNARGRRAALRWSAP